MSLTVIYFGDGIYTISDEEYGWKLCSVSFSAEAMEELDDFQQVDMLERLADWVSARLREIRDCDT